MLPVVYADGRANLTIVGPDAALQDCVEALPPEIRVDVAERLGCSSSTASEHLNRAESKLIKSMLR